MHRIDSVITAPNPEGNRIMKYMKYGPKEPLSPSVGDPCQLCGRQLSVGDYTALLRRQNDRKYADLAVEVHWQCAEVSSME